MSQLLHDRATRGECLTPQEQSQLQAWYAENDQTETDEITLPNSSTEVRTLRAQVENAVAELNSVSARIRELTKENDVARRENKRLQELLVQRGAAHSS